ncbi:MAG: RNA methyltransferase [Phycisphaerales bacterium]|nr:RNA methyltransferase [Phycisphaerales bacterium]
MTTPTAVDDPSDPRIESFRNVRDADLRGRDGLFCVESPRVVRRFLYALRMQTDVVAMVPRVTIHSLLTTPEIFRTLRDPLDGALASQLGEVPIYLAPESVLTEIAGYRMHKGALALGVRPERSSLDLLVRALGECDHLIIPVGVVLTDNIGAIFRNAGSLGHCGVLLAEGSSDPLHRKTIRISAGRVFSVPWAVSEDLPQDLARLRTEFGFAIVAGEDTPHSVPMERLEDCPAFARCKRVAIVLGAEGSGVSNATLSQCDLVTAIPMRPPGGLVESDDRPSLNVAVASALLLHGIRHAHAHSRATRL